MSSLAHHIKRGFIGMLLGANLCTILLLWTCVCCACISPVDYPKAALPCLAFPIFFGLNILFCLVWVLVHARMVWVPVAGMLCIVPYALDYCPVHFAQKTEPAEGALCVLSLNAGKLVPENFDMLSDYLERLNPDIICLQEMISAWKDSPRVQEWLEQQHYYSYIGPERSIISRFPILGDTLCFALPTRTNGTTACWIDVDGDSVLVFSNHLESNHLDPQEKEDYKELILSPQEELLRRSAPLMASKLMEAASYRGQQTDMLCRWLDEHPQTHVIMCGDFNDTPISYTYQQFNRRLCSAYRDSGCGIGFSYDHGGFFVRIDHIFHSAAWRSVSTYVDRKLDVSDHHPIVTYLVRR